MIQLLGKRKYTILMEMKLSTGWVDVIRVLAIEKDFSEKTINFAKLCTEYRWLRSLNRFFDIWFRLRFSDSVFCRIQCFFLFPIPIPKTKFSLRISNPWKKRGSKVQKLVNFVKNGTQFVLASSFSQIIFKKFRFRFCIFFHFQFHEKNFRFPFLKKTLKFPISRNRTAFFKSEDMICFEIHQKILKMS